MPTHEPLLRIASGGMASVWVGVPRAKRSRSELVALKRPHPHLLDDPGFRDALLREAHVASSLRHPNVVSVRAVEPLDARDAAEGALQLVMDYVEGAALGQLLVLGAKGGPRVPPEVALAIGVDLCRGLDALHELTEDGRLLGFVHRDVSPQNVLVGRDGRARLTDFGLAKCAWASEQPTTQGTLKGKLGYMAPEYIQGLAIDRRADVFALGVVLWEALAGRRLFRGENDADTLDKVARAPIPLISSIVPGLPDAFDALLARALDRLPDARWPTAQALGEALAQASERAGMALDRSRVAAYVERAVGRELADRRAELERLLTAAPEIPARKARGRASVIAGLAAALAAGGLLVSRAPHEDTSAAAPRRDRTNVARVAAGETHATSTSAAAEGVKAGEDAGADVRTVATSTGSAPRRAARPAPKPRVKRPAPTPLPPNPYSPRTTP